MFDLTTSSDTTNATSSPASADGPSPCGNAIVPPLAVEFIKAYCEAEIFL